MSSELEHLQEEVIRIEPTVPRDAFQFGFTRHEAEQYLASHPATPFIIRKSSQNGHFAITAKSNSDYINLLIAPPEDEHSAYKIYQLRDGIKTEVSTLSATIRQYWERFQARQKNIAVFSIQSLDREKVALSVNQLADHAHTHPGLEQTGDGHTGFAIAKALQAPFVVVRSSENRAENNIALQNKVANGGLLVVTGHGSPGGSEISGTYTSLAAPDKRSRREIERDPTDIVSSAIDAGLKSGDKITILLCICYGAQDPHRNGTSFAHKLARAFAEKGISTTIIASDKPVLRFGLSSLVGDKIQFSDRVGISPKSVHVFTTNVEGPDLAPTITLEKSTQVMELSAEGLQFISSEGASLIAPNKVPLRPSMDAPAPPKIAQTHESPRVINQEREVGETVHIQQQLEFEQQRRQRFIREILNNTKEILNKLDQKISAEDQHKTPEALNTAKGLLKDLHAAWSKLKQTIETPDADFNAARQQFKVECTSAIVASRVVLERDLGWGAYLTNLLKSLYNALAHVVTSNPNAFYSMTRSESLQTVEKAQSEIEAATRTVPPLTN